MNCRIPYLDNLYDNPTTLALARFQHESIRKELLEALDSTGDKLFISSGGYLRINTSEPYISEQYAKITELNSKYQPEGANPVVFPKRLLVSGKEVEVVGVDVRPLYPVENPVAELSDTDYQTLVEDPDWEAQTEIVTNMEMFADSSATNLEILSKAVQNIRSRLSQYVNTLRKGKVDAPDPKLKIPQLQSKIKDLEINSPEQKQQISDLREELEQAKRDELEEDQLQKIEQQINRLSSPDVFTTVSSVSNYIIQSANWIDEIRNNFFGSGKSVNGMYTEITTGINRETSEPLTPEEKQQRIRSVARELNKSRHYLYLFNGLEKLQQELDRAGYVFSTDKTLNRTQEFITDLDDLLPVTAYSKQQIAEFLKSDLFTESGLVDLIKYRVQQDNPDMGAVQYDKLIYQDLESVLNNHRSESTDAVLQEAINKAHKLKGYFGDFHDKLLTEWLYPVIEQKLKDAPDKYKLTKQEFKDRLSVGLKDEDFLKGYLDAAIKTEDPLLAAVANLLSDKLYEAHHESVEDAIHIQNIRDKENLEEGRSVQQLRDYHEDMVHYSLRPLLDSYERFEDADQDWIDQGNPVITVNVFGVNRKLKALRKKSLLNEWDKASFDTAHGLFYQEFSTVSKELLAQLSFTDNKLDEEGIRNLFTYLNSKTDNVYYATLLNKLFYKTRNGEYGLRSWVTDLKPSQLKWKLKQAMKATFYAENTQLVSDEKREALFKQLGWDTGVPSTQSLSYNTTVKQLDSDNTEAWRASFAANPDWLKSIVSKEDQVLVRKLGEDTREYVEWVNINDPTQFEKVTGYYYLGKKFTELNHDKYHITTNGFEGKSKTAWGKLQSDTKKLPYYQELVQLYESANQKAGRAGLKYYTLPQVKKLETVDYKGDWFTSFWNWFKQTTLGSILTSGITATHNAVTGKTTTESVQRSDKAYEDQYLNHDPIKQIPLQFTQDIADDQVEMDLARSILSYKVAANKYRKMREAEPMIQLLKIRVKGDTTLGIKARKFEKYNEWQQKLFGKKGETALTGDEYVPTLNKKLLQFLDDVVYGDEALAATFGGVDLQKVSQNLSKYTAFTSMALNVSASFANIGVGVLNNLSESVGGKFYTKTDMLEAEKLYWKNGAALLGDLSKPNPAKKSWISQLALEFDAIQGELTDEFGDISRFGNSNELLTRALYFTSSGAEHMIQMRSMLAQMNGFKLPSGRSLLDAVSKENGEQITWDDEVTPEIKRKFRQQLHAVNKSLHGHYAKFDKGMIQRLWIGKLAMMFHKYIYSSIRYRFGAERFDYELGETEAGYIRSYFNQLLAEMKDYPLPVKVLFAAGKAIPKSVLGSIDQLFAGSISNNITGIRSYLYGDESQRRNAAARQTMYDLMWLNLFALVAAGIGAAADDDDEFLQNVEVFARRMQGDIGMYLPFAVSVTGTPQVFSTYDKAAQLIKSPFAQLRAWDGTVSLTSQLFGVEYGEEGINFTINDEYTRSGPSYEKGDYKIVRKLEKSVIAPYYQIIRLMNPQEQLQYLNLSRKNSQ